MNLVAARPGDDVYRARGAVPLIRPHVAGLDGKLFHRVRERKRNVVVEVIVHILPAIERVADIVVSRPVDAERVLAGDAAARASIHHARDQQSELGRVAPVEGQVYNARLVHGFFQGRHLRFDLRGGGVHGNHSLHVADFHAEVDFHVIVGLQQDAAPLITAEGRMLHCKLIRADGKQAKGISAGLIHAGRANLAGGDAGQLNSGSGNSPTLSIIDGPKDGGGIAGLAKRSAREGQQNNESDRHLLFPQFLLQSN